MNGLMRGVHTFFRQHSYIIIIVTALFTLLTLVLTLFPIGVLHLPQSAASHDKLGHFLLFGGWTFLIGYYRVSIKPDRPYLILIFFVGVIFGGCVELLQELMPFHRDPTILDWVADSIGAFCSVFVLYLINKYLNE